ncbi:MAG: ABC transporter permease [Gemmatimonadales bacterium]
MRERAPRAELARWTAGPVAVAAGAVALTGALAAASLWLGGYDPWRAAAAAAAGAFGSPEAVVSITLVRAVPLVLTGLAVALAFRAGAWNIGAEGQLYAGAVAGVWVGLNGGALPGWLLVPLLLASAGAAGALWAAVPILMRLRLGVSEVITSLLMSFVGIDLAAYMVHGPLQEPRGVFPQTAPIAEAARMPSLVPGTRLHVGALLALGAAVGLWWLFRHTRLGFQVRAVGASRRAAEIAGRIDAGRVTLVAFLASGALAGLAGGVQVAGVTYALYEGLSPGWGYTAIAVALLADLHPLGVLVTGLLFGALDAGAAAMQREAAVPAVWATAVQALVILAVLALGRAQRQLSVAPASPLADV